MNFCLTWPSSRVLVSRLSSQSAISSSLGVTGFPFFFRSSSILVPAPFFFCFWPAPVVWKGVRNGENSLGMAWQPWPLQALPCCQAGRFAGLNAGADECGHCSDLYTTKHMQSRRTLPYARNHAGCYPNIMQHGLGTAQCIPLLSQLKSRLVPITAHAALGATMSSTKVKWLSWCSSTMQPHCTSRLTRSSCSDSALVTWTRRNKLPRSGSRGGRAIGDGRRPDTAAQSCLSVCYIFLPLFELLLTLLLCLDLSFRRGQQRHPNMCRFQGSNVICAVSAHQSCPSRRSECPQHKFLLIWRYSSEHLQSISLEAQQMYQ